MLKSLRIENFRCFRAFELQQLGKLNLLVGTNNSGKTSILEAVRFLCSQSIFDALSQVMLNRGEYIWMAEDARGQELDVRHLFHEHEINIGSQFSIIGRKSNSEEKLVVSIQKNSEADRSENLGPLALRIQKLGQEPEISTTVPLSVDQGLSTHLKWLSSNSSTIGVKTQYITPSSLTAKEMITLFDQVVLTPEEDLLVEALQTIEPRIERIASIGPGKFILPNSPGGLVIRLAGSHQRIPLRSLGDGIWRMLGLALALVNARNGVLLVDEIDTGLHFSTMADMWRLIWKTAQRLNVQIFATTHNSDCWTSLDAIASAETPSNEGIVIHRIEKGKPHSIVFTERQVVIAAQRGIEVR